MHGIIQELRTQAFMDERDTEFLKLLRTKYGIFIKKSQNSVFHAKVFRKFCTAFLMLRRLFKNIKLYFIKFFIHRLKKFSFMKIRKTEKPEQNLLS